MNRSLAGTKRTDTMLHHEVQAGNAAWWTSRPMTYDWHDEELNMGVGSEAWFAAIDQSFIEASRLFATAERPLDRILPLDQLKGKRVLEIGCGMGFHTETMIRAGGQVTAIDLTETAVDMTRRRCELRSLPVVEVRQADAERLPFADGSFDFVWSWGVIHHSSRTALIVREIARVLKDTGECRAMVYNREGTPAKIALLLHHYLKGGFLRRSKEETLHALTDGFSARYYVKEQFEDLFRAFFEDVSSEVCGQAVDVLPLPRRVRGPLLRALPDRYQRAAQARRGAFLFLRARRPF
jgi:2-polyprenyl-3-methyl-5-hydroxy-6-metoxy-1,4-benzoquinol methylase